MLGKLEGVYLNALLGRLRPAALREAAGWLGAYRTFWTTQLDSLERHLLEES